MQIGILADTHGRARLASKGIRLLIDEGAEHIVHCGDIADVGKSCLPVLSLLPRGRTTFVFGNTDTDIESARAFAEQHGMTCLGYAGVIGLAEKRIAVTHGHDSALMMELLTLEPLPDILLLGHTHVPNDQIELSPRRINPGSLYDPRAGSTTGVLILETSTEQVRRLVVLDT